MAKQPIYGEDRTIIDYFDDGQPEPETTEEDSTPLEDTETIPPEESSQVQQQEEVQQEDDTRETAPTFPWTIPKMLEKGTSDLFLGITVHADDGDPQGPRITLFVREVPGEQPIVRSFRAAELSRESFLDDLQKAITVTTQAYFLGWLEREKKRLEEEQKRKTRQQQSPQTPPNKTAGTTTTVPKTPPVPATKATAKEVDKQPEHKKYTVISLFDE